MSSVGARWPVLDLFFAVSVGYVAACDRLMK